MKSGRAWLLIIFVIIIGIYLWFENTNLNIKKAIRVAPAKGEPVSARETATVLWVTDGDTIRVLIRGQEDIVRLIGIDAPEIVDPKKSIQCFGKEAFGKAKEILTGRSIILESDSSQGDRDEYGRLLRYVFLQDGTNFDEFMIDKGFAREYTFKNNPYKYQSEFVQAQLRAREGDRGMWGRCKQN
jgi:micrococcal nuclease